MPPPSSRIHFEGFDEVHRVDCGGAVAFVALHAVLAGRAFGGVRIRDYSSEEAALDDAKALAKAMSRKVAMAGISGGGGKSVLIAPESDRAAAVRTLGAFIESLGGRYYCGPDLGFTREDHAALRETTKFFACDDLTPYTARSVLIAMRAACEPRTVAIQGLGAIGISLAKALQESGVGVVASNLRPIDGFETVPPDAIYDVDCDVFAPCATGGVLNSATIPRLKCRVVCGGANNPLATEEDAEHLRSRGIVTIPDFISNSGATIVGASTVVGESDRIESRMAAIGELTREILARAESERRSPHAVAVAMADARIAELRRAAP